MRVCVAENLEHVCLVVILSVTFWYFITVYFATVKLSHHVEKVVFFPFIKSEQVQGQRSSRYEKLRKTFSKS